MKNFNFDFEKDISINKWKLDEECVSHASIYYNYASACADARNELSKAKDRLKLTLADRYLEIKKYHVEQGDKVTEAMLANEVDSDSDVVEAREKVLECEDTLEHIMAGVSAMEQRRNELDNLVKLYCAGYFSTPVSSGIDRKDDTDNASMSIRKRKNVKE